MIKCTQDVNMVLEDIDCFADDLEDLDDQINVSSDEDGITPNDKYDAMPLVDNNVDDDECNTNPCIIDEVVDNLGDDVNWVKCIICPKWFHQFSVGVGDEEHEIKCFCHESF